MIESILVNLISTAIIYIVKKNLATDISEKEVKEDNRQIINQTNKFIFEGLSELEKNELKLYINDNRFQKAFAEYLINNQTGPIVTYFNFNLIPGDNKEKKVDIITKIKRLFDQKILEESQKLENKELIEYSTEKIIPEKFEKFEDDLSKVKEKDETLFVQLNALLTYNKEVFNEQKIQFGTNGVDRKIIVDIARLENEIKKILN